MIYNFNNISPKIDKDSWFAPNSVLIGNVTLKKDANIWFNATLRGDIEPITIGEGSNIQDGSVIHTDPGCPAKIGKNVTVGHLVMLHGCIIEDDCLIGIGSTILNKAKIGKNSIIGANALITENKVIPERSLVIGSPGKVIRQVTDEEIKSARAVNLKDLKHPEKDEDRAKNPEWLVMLGVCTHLGCVPLTNKGDYNAWFCPCHGSHYDTSGRIRKGPAPTNMEVPKYEFVNSNTIKIG